MGKGRGPGEPSLPPRLLALAEALLASPAPRRPVCGRSKCLQLTKAAGLRSHLAFIHVGAGLPRWVGLLKSQSLICSALPFGT